MLLASLENLISDCRQLQPWAPPNLARPPVSLTVPHTPLRRIRLTALPHVLCTSLEYSVYCVTACALVVCCVRLPAVSVEVALSTASPSTNRPSTHQQLTSTTTAHMSEPRSTRSSKTTSSTSKSTSASKSSTSKSKSKSSKSDESKVHKLALKGSSKIVNEFVSSLCYFPNPVKNFPYLPNSLKGFLQIQRLTSLL